jgi:hypothetical protein
VHLVHYNWYRVSFTSYFHIKHPWILILKKAP